MAGRVKAQFHVDKLQWALWCAPARRAFNKMGRLGFTHATMVSEADAVHAKKKAN